MNLRTEFAWLIGNKPITDALTQMASRINLVFGAEHVGQTGTHRFPSGLWTPTIGGSDGQSGQTYTLQDGSWVKAGQLVHAACRVQLSTLGTITGVVQIKGLPFPTVNRTGYRAPMPIVWGNLTTPVVGVTGILNENVTAGTLVQTAATTTSINNQFLVQADLSNTSLFVFSVLYETAG